MIAKLLKETQVAELLGVSVMTLRKWRSERRGPAYIKLGRSVRYSPKEIIEYQDRGVVNPIEQR